MDFSRYSDKFREDWYKKASAETNAFEKDRCANIALFGVKVGRFTAIDTHRKTRRNNVVSSDDLFGSTERVSIDTCLEEAEMPVDRNIIKTCRYVADYLKDNLKEDCLENTLNKELYRRLKQISVKNPILRLMVAWYIFHTGYLEFMTEKQASFWETDFQLFDLMEKDNHCNVNWLLTYTNIDVHAFYEYRTYIQEQLLEFREAFLNANA